MRSKTWTLTATSAILMLAACSSADFGGSVHKVARDSLNAGHDQGANPYPALDVSGHDGKPASKDGTDGSDGAPRAADGEINAFNLELDCDASGGGIIEVSSSGKGNKPLAGLIDDQPNQPPPGAETISLDKNGFPVDKDGKPLGKYVGGKPVISKLGPKGEPPLPKLPPKDVPPSTSAVATVKGRFCPASTRRLTVLFVVDFSGSMGRHMRKPGMPIENGNDPQINGSCGRLRAAEAIINQIKADRQPGDKIQVGFVPFASGVLTSKVVTPVEFDHFAAMVSKDTFCQYVVQSPMYGYDPINPGGIEGLFHGVNPATNYQAAFTAAQSLLINAYGRKVVYFISDGEPTVPGPGDVATPEAVNASILAGQALRDNVDNLTLNGLLLQNADLGAAAQDTLVKVAGAPERVRLASDAAALANEILKFPGVAIDPNSGTATLSVAPYPTKDLGLQYLKPDGGASEWIYETKPFYLLGVPGKDTVNTVQVTAKGTDGSAYSATVRIHYTP